jgi:hypothetical protein
MVTQVKLGELTQKWIFKQVPKYLATGLKRPSRTYSPPAEASAQGLKCKTNMIPILMHQMRISSLFSFTQAEKVENPKNIVKTVYEPKKTNTML